MKTANCLHYFESGKGEPLVLLHAQGTDSTSFENVIPKLAKHYHVYAVDCFGHGKACITRSFTP